jgi:DegT/DnrJ/EryC1/StrS aminotransferase family
VTVPFLDLRRESAELAGELRSAVESVLAESRFVGGDAVYAFESAFAELCGAPHAVGLGSGTAAIAIGLRALGVGLGDEVITAADTCVPTVAGIALSGATPVLADVDPVTLTLSPGSAAAAIGPRTKALVPVHLYGRRAAVEPLLELARAHGLAVLEDAAQGHGLPLAGDAAAFSFYPTKNLGASATQAPSSPRARRRLLRHAACASTVSAATASRTSEQGSRGSTPFRPRCSSRSCRTWSAGTNADACLPSATRARCEKARSLRRRAPRTSTISTSSARPNATPSALGWPNAGSRRSCTTRCRCTDIPPGRG